MAHGSATPTEVARGLWGGNAGDPEAVVAEADRICAQLRNGLSRWVGTAGYLSLLQRALELTRTDHPTLRRLSCSGKEEAEIAAAVRALGAAEVTAGLVAMIATLIDLLGRIIGKEMAVELVKQAVATNFRRDAIGETEGARNG